MAFIVLVGYAVDNDNVISVIFTACVVASGCSVVWLARLVWDQEVEGSNPFTPTFIKTSYRLSIGRHVPVAQLDRATAF